MFSSMNRVDALRADPLQTGRETPTNPARSHGSQTIVSFSVHPELCQSARRTAQPQGNALRLPTIHSAATAFVLSALAPTFLMIVIWHDARIAPMVFVFTFIVALIQAVMIGLPLFLICLSRGWINVGSCTVLGAVIGALPAGILSYPVRDPELHAGTWVNGMSSVANAVTTAAMWGGYIKPLMYFGLLGALGGFAFWTVLMCSHGFNRHRGCRGGPCKRVPSGAALGSA
jgi:hypothetical protein